MKNNTSKALAFPHDSYGFTLIEMLLVVGIIAVLTAVSIPLFSNSLENTKIHTDEANERAAMGAAMTEYLTGGTFPHGGVEWHIMMPQPDSGNRNIQALLLMGNARQTDILISF